MRFDGRIAVVTGSASGIGRATATALAADGAMVVGVDANPGDAHQDATVSAARADVGDEDAVQAVMTAVREDYGRVDVLVNCAGIYPASEWRSMSLAEWESVMHVNVRGVFLMSKYCSEIMIDNGYGRIVNVVSNTMLSGAPGMAHYVASKGAVWTLTRALARELGSFGVTVNAVAPGLTVTEGVMLSQHRDAFEYCEAHQCLPGRATAEDIVPAISFLAAEESRWITGQLLVCDGGMTHH